jgi:general secretion pathway protein K
MMRVARETPRSSQRGFVIIAVLWILVALSALATIFSVYLANSARALGATDIGIEAEALTSASLELTAYRLLLADEKSRPAQGSFRFRLDDADAFVTYTSEAARVDLNQAPKELLDGLFEVLGVEPKAAGDLADRIVGWRTKSKPNTANDPSSNATSTSASNATSSAAPKPGEDEGALYLAAGLNYAPRGGPFAHVDELSLVLGATPAIVERVLPFVTVYSKSAKVDVLLAPPEVVAALPGMTPEVLNEFSNGRRTSSEAVIALGNSGNKGNVGGASQNPSAPDGNPKDASSRDGNAGVKGDAKDKEPYSILSWQDQVETMPRPPRQAGR